eukprot:TRINITY_DN8317_c0_g1_i1.p1 TRINITY_DN8317_c0_g1~~TRINITY_DN8317_c0_g1_i1.p1  ORF type:complete len:695 (+),score=126.20 TRINITY_DN8317_c0_g1_i1:63-2147(+)
MSGEAKGKQNDSRRISLFTALSKPKFPKLRTSVGRLSTSGELSSLLDDSSGRIDQASFSTMPSQADGNLELISPNGMQDLDLLPSAAASTTNAVSSKTPATATATATAITTAAATGAKTTTTTTKDAASANQHNYTDLTRGKESYDTEPNAKRQKARDLLETQMTSSPDHTRMFLSQPENTSTLENDRPEWHFPLSQPIGNSQTYDNVSQSSQPSVKAITASTRATRSVLARNQPPSPQKSQNAKSSAQRQPSISNSRSRRSTTNAFAEESVDHMAPHQEDNIIQASQKPTLAKRQRGKSVPTAIGKDDWRDQNYDQELQDGNASRNTHRREQSVEAFNPGSEADQLLESTVFAKSSRVGRSPQTRSRTIHSHDAVAPIQPSVYSIGRNDSRQELFERVDTEIAIRRNPRSKQAANEKHLDSQEDDTLSARSTSAPQNDITITSQAHVLEPISTPKSIVVDTNKAASLATLSVRNDVQLPNGQVRLETPSNPKVSQTNPETQNLEEKLHSLTQSLYHLKESLNPENQPRVMGQYYKLLKEQLQESPQDTDNAHVPQNWDINRSASVVPANLPDVSNTSKRNSQSQSGPSGAFTTGSDVAASKDLKQLQSMLDSFLGIRVRVESETQVRVMCENKHDDRHIIFDFRFVENDKCEYIPYNYSLDSSAPEFLMEHIFFDRRDISMFFSRMISTVHGN